MDEVRGVMSQNIERVMERGEKLDDLVDKTGALEQNAVRFRQTSKKVRSTSDLSICYKVIDVCVFPLKWVIYRQHFISSTRQTYATILLGS